MMELHNRSMDGARSIAVIIIVFFHAAQTMLTREQEWISLFSHWIGLIGFVYLFVLSGYLMALSTERMFKDGRFQLRKFLIFRSARIFPAYLLSVILVWLIAWMVLRDWIKEVEPLQTKFAVLSIENFIRDLTFLFNKNTPVQAINGPVWSLRLEVVCYIILALVALAIEGGTVRRATICVIVLFLATVTWLRLQDAWIGLVGFSVGVATARWPKPTAGMARYPLWTVALGWGLVAFFFVSGHFEGHSEYRPWSKQLYVCLLMVASAAMIAPPLQSESMAQGFLRNFEKLASFSYTLYITHYPIMLVSICLLPTPASPIGKVALVLTIFFVAIAFSWPMSKVVETRDTVRLWLDRVLPGKDQTSRRVS